MKVLSTGQIKAENFPLILCLERAKFCKCTTSTLMRIHEKPKAFWKVGYRTWHGKGLLLMSGSTNHGQVHDNITKLGYYKPDMSSINFVVPDIGKPCSMKNMAFQKRFLQPIVFNKLSIC